MTNRVHTAKNAGWFVDHSKVPSNHPAVYMYNYTALFWGTFQSPDTHLQKHYNVESFQNIQNTADQANSVFNHLRNTVQAYIAWPIEPTYM